MKYHALCVSLVNIRDSFNLTQCPALYEKTELTLEKAINSCLNGNISYFRKMNRWYYLVTSFKMTL